MCTHNMWHRELNSCCFLVALTSLELKVAAVGSSRVVWRIIGNGKCKCACVRASGGMRAHRRVSPLGTAGPQRAPPPKIRKRIHSFFECCFLSLCLSRACLGTMMAFLHENGIAKMAFLYRICVEGVHGRRWRRVLHAAVRCKEGRTPPDAIKRTMIHLSVC